MLAAEIFGRNAGLVLFQDADYLRLDEPGLFHGGLLRGRWPDGKPLSWANVN